MTRKDLVNEVQHETLQETRHTVNESLEITQCKDLPSQHTSHMTNVKSHLEVNQRMAVQLAPMTSGLLEANQRMAAQLVPIASGLLEANQRIAAQLAPMTSGLLEANQRMAAQLVPIASGFLEANQRIAAQLAPMTSGLLEANQRIAAQLTPFTKTILEASQKASTNLTPFIKAMMEIQQKSHNIYANIGEVSQRVADFNKAISNDFSSIHGKIMLIQESFSDFYKSFTQVVWNYGEYRDKYMLMLMNLGWVPVTVLLPYQIRELVDLYENEGEVAVQEIIDDRFVEMYDSDILSNILKGWQDRSELMSRIQILESAIKNHIAGDYWSSIPTLLPQLEGMVVNANNHVGHIRGSRLESYYLQIIEGEDRSLEVLREFIDKELLANFSHGQLLEAKLSRHAILHGADVEYGTAANSLKAILLFDHLQERLFGLDNGIVESEEVIT